MALTYIDYTGNGASTTFAIPFDRIKDAHVKVYVANNLITSGYSIVANNVIFAVAPANGNSIRIKRQTEDSVRLIDFVDGSRLNEDDLDTDSKQAFYLVQEAKEQNELTTLGDIPDLSITGTKIAPATITQDKFDPLVNIGGATGGVSGTATNKVFYENESTVTTNYTISTGKNAGSFGPITINDGISVTIPDGSTYTIV
jgi:hypothetical protein